VVVLGDGAPWIWSLAAEGVRRERGYFAANAARTDSPAYRAAGLPVGSGAVESSAKQLVQLA
jgi:hypothetical protein